MIKEIFDKSQPTNEGVWDDIKNTAQNAYSTVKGSVKDSIKNTRDFLISKTTHAQKFYASGTTSKNGISFEWVVWDVIERLSDIRDKYNYAINREAVLAVEFFLRELSKKKSIKEINIGVDNVDSDANMEIFVWVKARNGGWLIVIDLTEIKVTKYNTPVTGVGKVKLKDDLSNQGEFVKGVFSTAGTAVALDKLFGQPGETSFTIPLKPSTAIYDKLEAIIK